MGGVLPGRYVLGFASVGKVLPVLVYKLINLGEVLSGRDFAILFMKLASRIWVRFCQC